MHEVRRLGLLCFALSVVLGSLALAPPAWAWSNSAYIQETTTQYRYIQDAINAATAGQHVIVYQGTWREHDLDFGGKAITVQSTDPSNPTVVAATKIDGNNLGSVFYFHNSETSSAVVQGLTITKGASITGAGIFCKNASPTITGNTITANNCPAGDGGGIYCMNGSPTITGNTITSNTAPVGSGGGIVCDNSSATITGNLISGNSVGVWGGGIICGGASPQISGNVISGNDATSEGAGICCLSGSVTISGNTIHGNDANSCIYVDNATVTITNSIITSTVGFGIRLLGGSAPTVTYCNVYGNSLGNYAGGAAAGTGCLSVDPLYANAGTGDFRLQSQGGRWNGTAWVTDGVTSPCIDTGDPAAPFANEAAPNGGRVNMGFDGNTAYASKTGGPTGLVLVSATYVDGNHVDALWSETVQQAGAETVSNYGIPYLGATAAVLQGDNKTVRLTTGDQDPGRTYTVFAHGVLTTGGMPMAGTSTAQWTPPAASAPTLVSATYVSRNQVDVLFSQALQQASAETAANYRIPYLTVTGAALQPDTKTVRLTTSLQPPARTFTVFVQNVKNAAGLHMAGTQTTQWSTPPGTLTLVSATYVDPTHVDALFSDALDQASAETTLSYQIPYLRLSGATLQADTKTVRLTTTPQPADRTLKVYARMVYSAAGAGMAEGQTAPYNTPHGTLETVSATYVDQNHVDVLFNDSLEKASAETVANYSSPYLTVSGAVRQPDTRIVRLTTTTQPSDRTFYVFVQGVYSATGVGMAGSPTQYEHWSTPPGTLVPVSATYVDPTHVDVLFNDALDQGTAETVANYSIPYLTVSEAVLQPDTKTVRLTTTTQGPNRTFQVFVSGVYSATAVGMANTYSVQWTTPGPASLASVIVLSGVSAQATPAGVAVTYTLSAAAEVEVTVTNVAGRVIARVPGGAQQSGAHTALWSGRSLTGTRAPAGRYLFQVMAADANGNRTTALVPAAR